LLYCCFAHARQHRRLHSTPCIRQVELHRSVCSQYSRNVRGKPRPRLRVSISMEDLSASPAPSQRDPCRITRSSQPAWRETATRREPTNLTVSLAVWRLSGEGACACGAARQASGERDEEIAVHGRD